MASGCCSARMTRLLKLEKLFSFRFLTDTLISRDSSPLDKYHVQYRCDVREVKAVVSNETVVLCRWRSSTKEIGLMNGVDNVN